MLSRLLAVPLGLALALSLIQVADTPSGTAAPAAPAAAAEPGPTALYGDTLTNAATWGNYRKVVAGSRAALRFDRRLTHRLVFDPGVGPGAYAPAVEALGPHSDLIGQLVDSFSMRRYNVAAYRTRARRYERRFGDRLAAYEVGNEINGEWLGQGAARKAHAAYRLLSRAGHATVLTPYYNPGCWSKRQHRMLPWLRRHIPADMRAGLDLVLVSYYERDCNGHRVDQAEMDRVFGALHRIFPHARLGWGELGLRRPVRRGTLGVARELMRHYYGLRPSARAVPTEQYVVGGFWWFGQQDLYPVRKRPLWRTFRSVLRSY